MNLGRLRLYDRRATSLLAAPGSSRATTAPLPIHFSVLDFAVGYASLGFACVFKVARFHAAFSVSAFIHDVPDEMRVERRAATSHCLSLGTGTRRTDPDAH